MFPNMWAQRFQQMPMGQFPQRPIQQPMPMPQPAPWGGQPVMQPAQNRFAPMMGQMQPQMPIQPQGVMNAQGPVQQYPNAYAPLTNFRPAGAQI